MLRWRLSRLKGPGSGLIYGSGRDWWHKSRHHPHKVCAGEKVIYDEIKPFPQVNEMKRFMIILLAAFITLLAFAAPVYSNEDEGDEANEADENGSGSDSEDDEKESTPGFEFAFAIGGALAAARLLKARAL